MYELNSIRHRIIAPPQLKTLDNLVKTKIITPFSVCEFTKKTGSHVFSRVLLGLCRTIFFKKKIYIYIYFEKIALILVVDFSTY